MPLALDLASTLARGCILPVATTERPELVSSGAGLASTVAAETHGELGAGAVRARGYWEGVVLRFRRDKFAIAGGFYIVFVILMAFVGAPIIAHILGHGPNDQFAGGNDRHTLLPVGPWTHISTIPYVGAVGHFKPTLFFAVPTWYANTLAADPELWSGADFSSVRVCVSAGEPLSGSIWERWQAKTGREVLDGIGSTECGHIFISNRMGEIRPSSTRRATKCRRARSAPS